MATYTSHYNLKKPAATDLVDVADLNGNADIIDGQLYENAQAAAAAYTKPSTGIPKTDLASDVQTSLGKADTALQPGAKGAANGVASLDESAKVPSGQLPDALAAILTLLADTSNDGKVFAISNGAIVAVDPSSL